MASGARRRDVDSRTVEGRREDSDAAGLYARSLAPPASREQFQAAHARATACVFASKAAPARVLRCAAPLLPVTDRPLPVCHSACRAVRDRRGGPACRWMRAVPLPGAPCRLGWFGLVAVGWLVGPRVAVALYDDPSRVRRACRARLGWVGWLVRSVVERARRCAGLLCWCWWVSNFFGAVQCSAAGHGL